MKAWLVTWEWIGDHAAVTDPLIALFSSRRSDRYVSDFVEQYYLAATSSAAELAYLLNRPNQIPYKVTTQERINGVIHSSRITVGHNPYIYGRKISSLVVRKVAGSNKEEMRWKEPDSFRHVDKLGLISKVASVGRQKSLVRAAKPARRYG